MPEDPRNVVTESTPTKDTAKLLQKLNTSSKKVENYLKENLEVQQDILEVLGMHFKFQVDEATKRDREAASKEFEDIENERERILQEKRGMAKGGMAGDYDKFLGDIKNKMGSAIPSGSGFLLPGLLLTVATLFGDKIGEFFGNLMEDLGESLGAGGEFSEALKEAFGEHTRGALMGAGIGLLIRRPLMGALIGFLGSALGIDEMLNDLLGNGEDGRGLSEEIADSVIDLIKEHQLVAGLALGGLVLGRTKGLIVGGLAGLIFEGLIGNNQGSPQDPEFIGPPERSQMVGQSQPSGPEVSTSAPQDPSLIGSMGSAAFTTAQDIYGWTEEQAEEWIAAGETEEEQRRRAMIAWGAGVITFSVAMSLLATLTKKTPKAIVKGVYHGTKAVAIGSGATAAGITNNVMGAAEDIAGSFVKPALPSSSQTQFQVAMDIIDDIDQTGVPRANQIMEHDGKWYPTKEGRFPAGTPGGKGGQFTGKLVPDLDKPPLTPAMITNKAREWAPDRFNEGLRAQGISNTRISPKARERIARASKILGRILGPAAAALVMVEIGSILMNDELSDDQKIVQLSGVIGNTIGGIAGAWTGGIGGAAIGTAIFPGIGTAVGGVVGAISGGITGSLIMRRIVTGVVRHIMYNEPEPDLSELDDISSEVQSPLMLEDVRELSMPGNVRGPRLPQQIPSLSTSNSNMVGFHLTSSPLSINPTAFSQLQVPKTDSPNGFNSLQVPETDLPNGFDSLQNQPGIGFNLSPVDRQMSFMSDDSRSDDIMRLTSNVPAGQVAPTASQLMRDVHNVSIVNHPPVNVNNIDNSTSVVNAGGGSRGPMFIPASAPKDYEYDIRNHYA